MWDALAGLEGAGRHVCTDRRGDALLRPHWYLMQPLTAGVLHKQWHKQCGMGAGVSLQ